MQEVSEKDAFYDKVVRICQKQWSVNQCEGKNWGITKDVFKGKYPLNEYFFCNFLIKTLADSKNSRTFALAIENESNQIKTVW